MDIYFDINGSRIDLKETPTILVCGYTGCGKTYLLKNIHNQLSNKGGVQFLFIDLKKVEWLDVVDKNQIMKTVYDVNYASIALDTIFSKQWENPLIVIWDTFDDYVFGSPENFDRFQKLLQQGPSMNIYAIASTSRQDAISGFENLFKAIFIGAWKKEYLDFLSEEIKIQIKNPAVDLENLPTSKFLYINSGQVKTIQVEE